MDSPIPATIAVKICGLSSADAVDAAVEGGAAFAGFVFYPPSPRHIPAAAAAALIARLPASVTPVGVFVDPDDDQLDNALAAAPLRLIQLHGYESPARVAALRARLGIPIMKALPVASADDVAAAHAYDTVADRLLFDAKPPLLPEGAGAQLPGGNGLAFDWQLLAAAPPRGRWMLSGGLNAANLADAVRISGAEAVDVSSGVESRPGQKNLALISTFLAQAAALAT